MTPQELKASILQMAIQGKLVEQRPEEGSGEELYQQIQAEKQALIKAGKIKKEKPLPEIIEDEIPFDIPESWKWYRLGELTYNWGQKTPDNRFCYVDVGSVNNASHTLNSENTVVEAKDASSRAKKIVKYGDVIFATIRPYLKNICIIDRVFPYEPIVSTAFAVMHCPEGLLNKYLYYYLLSPTFMSFANASDKAKGVAYPAIGEKDFFNGIIALPPLAEQKRIVAKIEELLPLIDRYEQAWSRLEDFNKRFPVDMQKSILQMAIQGKLVEQRPEEGTGEKLYQQIQAEKQVLIERGEVYREKELSNISDDEIPFDIPNSWTWCKLGELTKTITKGSSPKWQGVSYTDKEHGILFVTSENVGAEQLLLSKEKYVGKGFNAMHPASILQKGDLLTNIVGASIGRTAVFDLDVADANINQAVCIIRLVNQNIADYVLKFLNSAVAIEMMTKKSVDSARANLSLTSVTNLLIPLPPLAEQKRIVAKLEEILPLCERLK